jgi:hypothetical protein
MSREADIKAYMEAVAAGTISQEQLQQDMQKFGVSQSEIDSIMGGSSAPSGGSAPAAPGGDYWNSWQYESANPDVVQAYDREYRSAMDSGKTPLTREQYMRQHYDSYGKAEGRNFGSHGAMDAMWQNQGTTEKTPEQLAAIKKYWEASATSGNRQKILEDMVAQGVTSGDIAKAIGANPMDVANFLNRTAAGAEGWLGGGSYNYNTWAQGNSQAAQDARFEAENQPGAFTTGIRPGYGQYDDRGNVKPNYTPPGTTPPGGSGGTTPPGTTIPNPTTPPPTTPPGTTPPGTTAPPTPTAPTTPTTPSSQPPMGMMAFWQQLQKDNPQEAATISGLPSAQQTRALVQAYRKYLQQRGTGLLDIAKRDPFTQGFQQAQAR